MHLVDVQGWQVDDKIDAHYQQQQQAQAQKGMEHVEQQM
jgi:hypothetical protein